ncbi:uncharacterized protein LOC111614031 [Centruroides sculpturatus]|uniref:uncharacterized protein LOC111614031 n=1 Tax=Centruroides sculpturatus TaxID=218467 RepID=UPI000C6F0018|nr:uncharacterized protein LOC111614031 [Centruroides sculpturatus]
MPPHLGTSTAVPTHTIPVNSVPQGSVGSHSNASTPHSHASSPVNQPPSNGTHITPAHTPTPTGHPGPALTPQPIVYHGLIQHSLQSGTNVLNSTTSLNNHIAHFNQHSHNNHPNYEASSHLLVFMPQQFHPVFQSYPIHGQNPGNHTTTPTQIIPHSVIHSNAISTSMASAPFIPNHQAENVE